MQREEMRVSANGIPVYSYRNEALHGFFLSLYVRAGVLYEANGQTGITHFLEHILVRNVEKLSGGTLYRELDRAGLEFNATTYNEMIQFYVSGSTAHFDLGAGFLAELLSPLALSRDEIDAERKRIKAEIREADERNSLTAFSNAIVYGKTPLAGSILGTIGNVNARSGADLEAYRKSVFKRENIFFYLTGNFTDRDEETLLSRIGAHDVPHGTERTNVAEVPAGFFRRAPEIGVKSGDYTAMRFSFDLDMTKISVPETDLLYDVLLSGNDSRFYIEMSELRGMFYDVSGSIERYANIGSFYFTFEVKERDVPKAAELVVDILNDFCKTPVPPEDMMKSGYVDNAWLLYDDARDFNFAFATENHIGRQGYRDLEDRIDAYRRVTPERLCEVAREVFRPENLVLTVKGNKNKIDCYALYSILKNLGKDE